MKTVYIYLNAKEYDGTVFVTQVADWLNLYRENDVDFKYIHLFFYRNFCRNRWKKEQIKGIKSVLPKIDEISYALPSRGIMVRINAIMLARQINKVSEGYDNIVMFSRMLYGKEYAVLKKIINKPFHIIYDGRAASIEEHKYNAVKRNHLNKSQFDMFSHISYTECVTCQQADKIFSVSNVLKKYLMINYGISEDKFFIYPCLSDQRKFYYDESLRQKMRQSIGYDDTHKVYLYAGGLYNAYHSLDKIVAFLNIIAGKDPDARFILLSRDKIEQKEILEHYPALLGKFFNQAVPNSEMVKYLNAADFGILFRENVPMNNVASPSKFAEYIMSGLPTIISEGVGDYSSICEPNGLGVLIPESQMKDLSTLDFEKLCNATFDRKAIAEYGKQNLSKQARLPYIIEQFKSFEN